MDNNMKEVFLSVIIFFSLDLSYGQIKTSGKFIGIMPIRHHGDSIKSTSKWYHISELIFAGDSVRLLMKPVVINANDTISTGSEGGVYSYAGSVDTFKGSTFINLVLVSCVNCPDQFIKFIPPKLVNDNGVVQLSSKDSDALPEPPLIENTAVKYRTLLVEKTRDRNTLIVGGVVFLRVAKVNSTATNIGLPQHGHLE
jgi:hypothetical protein